MNYTMEAFLPSATESKAAFHHRLESLRGVAALMVAGWHSFLVLQPPGGQQAAFADIQILLNGNAAVVLFFVLSGLVLGLSWERSNEPFGINYVLFCARRLLRICPAHLVALLVIFGAILSFDTVMKYPAGVSIWFANHWHAPITQPVFRQNFLFQNCQLNVPTWTLKIELICSFVLPVLVLISQRVNWIGRAVLLALLMAVSGRSYHWEQRLYLFYLGYLVPTAGSVLTSRLRTGSVISRYAPSLAFVLLLMCEAFAWRIGRLGGMIEGVMAGVFVNFLYHGHETGWFKAFDWPIVRFYGKISYSFYLYHMVTLYFCVKLAIRSIPAWGLMAQPMVTCLCFFLASTVIATLLGWLSYRIVERPVIEFSKQLPSMLPKRAIVVPGTG